MLPYAVGNKYFYRIRVKPPVQQIEMMGLMHQQVGAAVLQSVPTSEIGGTVVNIEIPIEINGSDLAHLLLLEQFLDFCHVRAPTVVKSDDDLSVGSTFLMACALSESIVNGFPVNTSHPASSALMIYS